jgi:hypothetical protein
MAWSLPARADVSADGVILRSVMHPAMTLLDIQAQIRDPAT